MITLGELGAGSATRESMMNIIIITFICKSFGEINPSGEIRGILHMFNDYRSAL